MKKILLPLLAAFAIAAPAREAAGLRSHWRKDRRHHMLRMIDDSRGIDVCDVAKLPKRVRQMLGSRYSMVSDFNFHGLFPTKADAKDACVSSYARLPLGASIQYNKAHRPTLIRATP